MQLNAAQFKIVCCMALVFGAVAFQVANRMRTPFVVTTPRSGDPRYSPQISVGARELPAEQSQQEPSFVAAETDDQLIVRQWTNTIRDARDDLRVGDQIVKWDGVTLASKRELVRLWQAKAAGDRSAVAVRRQTGDADTAEELIELDFTHKGVSDYFRVCLLGDRTSFRRPDEIVPKWDTAPSVLRQVAFAGLGADGSEILKELEHAFRKLTDELLDFYRGDHITYLLNHPFQIENWSRYQVDALAGTDRPSEILATAWTLCDPEIREWVPVSLTQSAAVTFDDWVRHLESRVAEIDSSYAQAFSGFSPAELEELIRWASAFRPLRKSDVGWSELIVGLQDAKRVDLAKLQIAFAQTAALLDEIVEGGAIYEGLRATADKRNPDQVFAATRVFDKQNDEIPCDQAVIIDLGGNDTYQFNENLAGGIGTQVIVDFSGNDTFNDDSQRCGSASLCSSLIVDAMGDDKYLGRERTQGSAVLGCGVIWDVDGRDRYTCQRNSQGFACNGIGLIVDRGGDDEYSAGTCAQGIGLAAGCGAIIDRSGNDRYRCTGLDPSSYGDAGEFSGMGQGIGWGIRWVCAGGVGILVDGSGDDRYDVGQFGLGCGYCFGIGIVNDREGHDHYECSRYGLGTGAHFGAGVVLDDGGDDRYFAVRNAAIAVMGSCWDLCVSALIDSGGDDEYNVGNYALGGAAQNAFGLFWDKQGRDMYRSSVDTAGQAAGFAGQATYGGGRLATNLAVFLDEGGRDDTYSVPGRENNASGVNGAHGVWLDR